MTIKFEMSKYNDTEAEENLDSKGRNVSTLCDEPSTTMASEQFSQVGHFEPTDEELAAGIDYSDLEIQFGVSESKISPDLATLVVIDQLPRIDMKKEEKLVAVLKKNVFGPAKATAVPGTIFMPREQENDPESLSKGWMYVQFSSKTEAAAVVGVANGYRLDKTHVLAAYSLADFDRILATPNADSVDSKTELESLLFVPREYLRSWLSDEQGRDQFVVLAGTTATVSWNVRSGCGIETPPELVHTRASWTESTLTWSPRGAYLATLHSQGVMLWGGKSFMRMGRFPHPRVRLISFSPAESYMVTWSPPNDENPNELNLLIWEVSSCRLLRSMRHTADLTKPNPTISWPVIKFSYDEKFAARVQDSNSLAIYHTSFPSCDSNSGADNQLAAPFSLVDKRCLTVEGLQDFSWSPVDGHLVHWTTGTEDIPSRVALLAPPVDPTRHTRTVLRTKNLFNVTRCEIHWHSNADFLCIQVERHSKNKKQILTSVELFRLRDRGVPVETVDFISQGDAATTTNTSLTHFAWEPEGDRFIAGFSGAFSSSLALYSMSGKISGHSAVVREAFFERKTPLQRLIWSPRGTFLLIVGTGGGESSGSTTLEWIDCSTSALENDSGSGVKLQTLATREHYMATDVAWDPSGRYVASWVSAWKHNSDTGFQIWDLRGTLCSKINLRGCALFQWRPRPPTLLSSTQKRDVRRNLRELSLRFEEEDLRLLTQSSSDTAQQTGRLILVWNEWRRHCRRDYETRNSRRRALLGGKDDECTGDAGLSVLTHWTEEEVIEETVETLAG